MNEKRNTGLIMLTIVLACVTISAIVLYFTAQDIWEKLS